MTHYLCREKYRLELHWKSIEYSDDSSAVLKGAYLSGPALKMAQEVKAPDKIDIDLTPQHLIVLNSYYIIRLEWQLASYKDDKIFLGAPRIVNQHLKSLHKLENSDYIVIDTEKHEESTHPYNLVYEAQVIRADKEPYRYGR